MLKLIDDLWFKRRDIVSDGFDESLEYISRVIPLKILEIPTGSECWTWRIPEKWGVNAAYIEELGGKRILDLKDHPLHVLSYSLPIDMVVSRDVLLKHLHSNPERPQAIPFEFKYYEKDWGFCIQHARIQELDKDEYRVLIDSKFEKGTLKVGEFTIPGKSEEIIFIVAHLCHPSMVDDDLTGVSVLVDIAKRMIGKSSHYTYKFLLVPETVGSVAYLSNNEDLIPKIKYAIFLEMLGNKNSLSLQHSRQGDARIDRVARYVMKRRIPDLREGDFRKIVGNDEIVFNGPGVNVPMISVSRFPYPEYHTSDDNPGIISEERLEEARDVVLDILRILETDYSPKRTFKGPVFLSGYGLWVDWRINPKLNENIEEIMLSLEGDKTVFDIAEALDMEYVVVLNYVNCFLDKGLVVSGKEPSARI